MPHGSKLASIMGLVVLASGVTLVGAIQKAPCADRPYVEQREGASFQCYSDIPELLKTEQLLGGRLPYLDPCIPQLKPCDEYPVGTMYVMRATAWISQTQGDPYTGFYWMSVVLLIACAVLTVRSLQSFSGASTMLFAAAPTLAIYGTMNWDLIPVMFSTAATVALARRKDAQSGILLGLGGAAKIYPLLLVLPFALHLHRQGGSRASWRFVAWATGTWIAVNLPFAMTATDGWWTFFRFNAERPAEFDSLWRVACEVVCANTGLINVLSGLGTALIAGLCWHAKKRRWPSTPLWHLGFPVLIGFLLANKIWSPQYGLWLLPWFALVARSFTPFLAYQATEVLVYLARFSFFPAEDGVPGTTPYSWLAGALLLRAAALIWCVLVWIRTPVQEGVNGTLQPATGVTEGRPLALG